MSKHQGGTRKANFFGGLLGLIFVGIRDSKANFFSVMEILYDFFFSFIIRL